MLHRLMAVTLLFLIALPAWAEIGDGQRLHVIRSNGFLLASNLLVYFNNHDPASTFSPEARETYHASLGNLQKLIKEVPDNRELAGALQSLEYAIGQLEQQPEDTYELYARWINPVLRAHAELERAAAAAYSATNEADPATSSLHQQNIDIGRMLLLYETQAFTNLGIFAMDYHEGSFQEIDQRITSRQATLHELLPGSGDALDKIWTDYHFIRPQLLSRDQQVVSRSATIYLGKSMSRLDGLAAANKVAAR